jgi:lipoyl-dependent peroxiredoxin
MAIKTSATTTGGPNGRAVLENGGLALAMALQKELGGSGEGHNPEQLFALGYSACFGQALLAIGKKHGIDAQDARVTATVSLITEGGFSIAVDLTVHIPGADKAAVEKLVTDAHENVCPYSKATRNNVPVTLTVV